MTLLSVVVPVYNEEKSLLEFHRRLAASLQNLPCRHEIIYCNDGSRDNTLRILQGLRAEDASVGILNLSRNFGKEAAMTAGIDNAKGDAVVVIDADLQHPPELIGDMYRVWNEEKVDVVYAERSARNTQSWVNRRAALTFYKILSQLSDVEIPANVGDFRLMSRRVVNALLEMRERHRFMKGLFAWVGFTAKGVPYYHDTRFAGESKWSTLKLWHLSLEGITGFSIAPLRLASYAGLAISAIALVYASWIVIRTFFYGIDVPGYASLFTAVLFLNGIQLIFLGVLGEYIGRVFNETKRRPLYIVQDHLPVRGD